jgi:hypothetical protein
MIRVGDIAGYAPHGYGWALSPISWLIKQFQSCEVTHTGIVVDPRRMVLVEAWWPRARYRVAQDEPGASWRIYRPRGATPDAAEKAACYAEGLVGTRYDLKSIGSLAKWLAAERILGLNRRNKVDIRDDDGKLYCQELITFAYLKAGVDLAEHLGISDPSAVVPADVAKRIDVFERIR